MTKTPLTRPMLRLTLVALALLSASARGQIVSRKPVIPTSALPAASCPAPRDSAYDATVVVSPIARKARTAVVTICLGIAPRLASVAKYDGTLTFATSMAAFDTAARPSGGSRTIDARTPGVVSFGGAKPSGLPGGALLTVRLRLLVPGVIPPLALKITDLQTTNGASAMQQLWVQGRGPIRVQAHRPGGVPLIKPTTPAVDSTPRISAFDRQSVSAATLATGQVVTVTIGGSNFDRTDNTVMFGPVSITNVGAELGVLIRFSVPTSYQSRNGAPPLMITAGDYPITVKNSRGTSNAVLFRITP